MKNSAIPVAVVCALIVDRDKILIVQHGPGSKHPGMWEFPGGKIHPGESPEVALSREIMEELGIQVNILHPLEPVDFEYPGRSIRLTPFVCRYELQTIVLHEHQAFVWLEPEDMDKFELLPADRKLLDIGENSLILKRFLSESGNQE